MNDYNELIKRLREDVPTALVNCDFDFVEDWSKEASDAIEQLTADLERSKEYEAFWNEEANEALRKFQLAVANKPRWIPVTERLPKCEQEVLICTEKKLVGKDAYIDSIVTPAIYEDGTMTENDSIWHWEDIDWAGWDEKEDCGIIPEGWWENRHFNPDEVYNNPVDRKVVAWMALPKPFEPPKEE